MAQSKPQQRRAFRVDRRDGQGAPGYEAALAAVLGQPPTRWPPTVWVRPGRGDRAQGSRRRRAAIVLSDWPANDDPARATYPLPDGATGRSTSSRRPGGCAAR
ncbi:hypothetical protein I552_4864 [Mycobacterium xenopi 3993]|nr:hypothetical protein I552_4864 [Mycobacterium xenopi 3993]